MFTGLKNVRQTKQDAERVYCDVNLSRQTFHLGRRG